MMNENRKPIKLHHKILITNMLFFALPCLIAFLSIVSLIRTEGNQRVNQNRKAILEQIDSSMEAYLNHIAICIQYVWEDYGMNQLISKREFTDEESRITAKMSIIDFLSEKSKIDIDESCDLMVLGENGYNYSTRENVNNSTIVYPNLSRLKDEMWFQSVLENSRIHYIATRPSKEYSSLTKDSALHAVCRIKDFSSGHFAGIIDVNITHERIREIFSKAILQENQEVALIDQEGNFVTSTSEKESSKNIFTEEYIMKILSEEEGYYSTGTRNPISQIHFVTNNSTGWKIVMYEENPWGEWFYIRDSIGIISVVGLCLFLVFIMSIYDARNISKPVKKLKEYMHHVYKGDFSVRMEVESIDEFRELNLQFNRMVERIEKLLKQLKEKEEEARILELQALQAQINPHFLYNTLASIRFLLEMGMEEKACESLMALGKLLHRTFSDYRNLIPINEEVQALENYLILMNNRYQNTFEWTINVDENIKDYLIPRISIQPLVENSISHGFSNFIDEETKGHIWITGRKEEDTIIINIKDNGRGADIEKIKMILSDETFSKRKEQVSSIGIKNVQERFRLFFGEEYGLTFYKEASEGISVNLCMPLQKDKGKYVKDNNCR